MIKPHHFTDVNTRQRYVWPFVTVLGIALCSLLAVSSERLFGQEVDPGPTPTNDPQGFIYELRFGTVLAGVFEECHGLGSSNEILQQIVATEDERGVILGTAGTLTWHTIVLKRIGPSDGLVVSWRKSMEDGLDHHAFRDGTITLFESGSMEPLAGWAFDRGWAASLVFSGGVEELTIVHEGLNRLGVVGDEPAGRRRR